jgi:hypothetical protein
MSTFNVPILDGAGKIKSANLPNALADIVSNGGVTGGGGTTGPISYNDLTDKPVLVTSYTQLTNKPTIPTSYNDLTDKPTIPVVNTASTTVSGVVELATTAETTAGTDTVRAVTPAGLKSVADTKVGTDGTVLSVVKLTQAAYTALGASVSATTLYVIVG